MPHPEKPVDSMQLVIDNFRNHSEVAVVGGLETSTLGTDMLPVGHNPVHQLDIFVHAVEPVLNMVDLNTLLTSLAPPELPPTKVEPFEILSGGYIQFGRLQFDQKLGTIANHTSVALYEHTALSKDRRLAKNWDIKVVGELWQQTRVRLFPTRATAIEAGHDNNKYGCFVEALSRRKDNRVIPKALLQTPLLKGVVRRPV